MFRMKCPWCGERDAVEFTYDGDATIEKPEYGRDDDRVEADWYDAVYTRDNPRGPHVEWWHHATGCRQWIRVMRDTHTHEILATGPARGALTDKAGAPVEMTGKGGEE